jgi:hypothetical protein
MRQNRRTNLKENKRIARIKYGERQIDKFVKWSISKKGYVKFKDICRLQKEYNIKCYG